jgi:hypothetical protein
MPHTRGCCCDLDDKHRRRQHRYSRLRLTRIPFRRSKTLSPCGSCTALASLPARAKFSGSTGTRHGGRGIVWCGRQTRAARTAGGLHGCWSVCVQEKGPNKKWRKWFGPAGIVSQGGILDVPTRSCRSGGTGAARRREGWCRKVRWQGTGALCSRSI